MKIVLLIRILFLSVANILAEKTITCKINRESTCEFFSVTIGPNEAVSVETDPRNADVSHITFVEFSSSSIYSVPGEIFTKFPNLKTFIAFGQRVQEIKADTFMHGKNLNYVHLSVNNLKFLHADTFKGKKFQFRFFVPNNNSIKFCLKARRI
jgi:hypothetical protein